VQNDAIIHRRSKGLLVMSLNLFAEICLQKCKNWGLFESNERSIRKKIRWGLYSLAHIALLSSDYDYQIVLKQILNYSGLLLKSIQYSALAYTNLFYFGEKWKNQRVINHENERTLNRISKFWKGWFSKVQSQSFWSVHYKICSKWNWRRFLVARNSRIVWKHF
jgi:hypothetical protein